ncbi:hypothetical protein FRC02_010837, partial [Tulasnella sp. 418]
MAKPSASCACHCPPQSRYSLQEAYVSETVTNSSGGTTVIERVGDEVDEFAKAVPD